MAKALVTGGTGFVGAHVVRVLVEAGHEVRVFHRASSRLDALAGVAFEPAIGELLDAEALLAACTGCDWVFHVAAVADYWQTDLNHMLAVNVEGTRRVLAAARAAGVGRVIFTSSAAALAISRRQRLIDETMRFNARPHDFPYGYSKYLAEDVALHAVRTYGQDVVILNPVIILGPADLNMISGRFITEMLRLQWLIPVTPGGIAVTDVRDVARWQLLAAEKGRAGERYILGTQNYSMRDWYALVAQTVGVTAPFLSVPGMVLPWAARLIDMLARWGIRLPVDADQTRLGDKYIYFCYDKAHTELGSPQIPMDDSLRDTLRWYDAHGYLPQSTPLTGWLRRVGRWLRAV